MNAEEANSHYETIVTFPDWRSTHVYSSRTLGEVIALRDSWNMPANGERSDGVKATTMRVTREPIDIPESAAADKLKHL